VPIEPMVGATPNPSPGRRTKAIALSIAGAIVLLVAISLIAVSRSLPEHARQWMLTALQERYGSDVQVAKLDVTVFPRIQVTGEKLVLRLKDRPDAPPLITIEKFSADSGLLGLLRRRPDHVRLEGLRIDMLPRGEYAQNKGNGKPSKHAGFVAGEIDADGTVLTIHPKDAWKKPLVYEIRQLHMNGAANDSLSFHATLTNATPPGQIQSTGSFGPWDKDDPGGTPVSGDYTFQNADLSVFKGIAGTLSSNGDYHGSLNGIHVEGTTDTPNFSLKEAGNPVHLTSKFKALVDGTKGNVSLQPVTAQFVHSVVTARGDVTGTPGVQGRTVSLDTTMPNGRLEDVLLLGVKGRPLMNGTVNFQAKLVIPPGDVEIDRKLKLNGAFQVASVHFSRLNIQETINKLSHRGQGRPEESSASNVASDFKGQFALDHGVMTFHNLSFRVPGILIAMDGTYGLLDGSLDFHGTASLQAKLSQTTTGIKSVLLKAVDRFFEKKNGGAVIPFKVEGTRENPRFGLDLHRKNK
jgi:AsmA-like C-terminal region